MSGKKRGEGRGGRRRVDWNAGMWGLMKRRNGGEEERKGAEGG